MFPCVCFFIHLDILSNVHFNATKDTEKMKVLQSIASVIQALPPEEEIPPVEVSVAISGALQNFANLILPGHRDSHN